MSVVETYKPEAGPGGLVRVNVLAGPVVTLEFVPGQTVGDYIAASGMERPQNSAPTLNGAQASDDDIVLEGEATIVIVPKIMNG